MTNDKAIQEALEACRDEHGVVTPEAVVEAARDHDSPLHEFFPWDVGTAAHEHWLYVARSLIRRVRVVVSNEVTTIKVPLFVRNPDALPREQGYVSIKSLRSDVDRARDVMARECALALGALQRAQGVAIYLDPTSEFEDVQQELARVQRDLQRLTQSVAAATH